MLLDIRGEEVQIGDKVLCAVDKKHLALGVFEKVSKVSFIIRIGGSTGYAFSIPNMLFINNPAYHWRINNQVPHSLKVDNDAPNKSILKVDKEFSL